MLKICTLDSVPLSRHPIEIDEIAAAVPKRQTEYLAGRTLLRNAIRSYGIHCETIGRDRRGCPILPDGIHAGISHSADRIMVACSADQDCIGLAVDIERRAIDDDILDEILRPEERESPRGFQGSQSDWYRLVFSAKECLFKAQFPRLRLELEFNEFQIQLLDGNRWSALPHSASARKVTQAGALMGNSCWDQDWMNCVVRWVAN